MKIAVCLYGQPRQYTIGYQNINYLVSNNKNHTFDFFFHTWYDEKMVGDNYEPSIWCNAQKSDLLITKNTIDELVNLYKPKNYLYDPPRKFMIENIEKSVLYMNSSNVKQQNVSNSMSNLYSKQQSCKVLQDHINTTNDEYEIIISCRFDFLNPIDNIDIDLIDPSKINCMYTSDERTYIVDHIILCNYRLFLEYSQTYSNIKHIMNNHLIQNIVNKLNCGFDLAPESLVTCNIAYYYSNNITDIILYNKNIPNFR